MSKKEKINDSELKGSILEKIRQAKTDIQSYAEGDAVIEHFETFVTAHSMAYTGREASEGATKEMYDNIIHATASCANWLGESKTFGDVFLTYRPLILKQIENMEKELS